MYCVKRRQGLCYGNLVNGTLYTVNAVELAQSATDQTAEVWHQRLGHLNNNSVDQLHGKERNDYRNELHYKPTCRE